MEPTALVFVSFLVLTLLADHFVIWRRFTASAVAAPETARRRLWQSWLGMLWGLALAAVLSWALSGRPWGQLGLVLPRGWRAVASVGLVLVVLTLYLPSISKLRRAPAERLAALRGRFGSHAAMLPHTRGDLLWFIALAVSAGICEELVFRGCLLSVVRSAVGLRPATIVSCLVFSVAHAYQGVGGIVRTGLIGAVFTVVVLGLGSLIPAIVAHALVDIGQGVVAWLVLRQGELTQTSAISSEENVAVARPPA